MGYRTWRWTSNLSLVLLNRTLVRIIIPVTAVSAAMYAGAHEYGLFSLVDWPLWLEVLLAVIAFDLAIYLQHVMFHAVPLFWRLHMVHHADLDLDVTTGLRFHTLEILLSTLIKLSAVLVIGSPVMAVVVFEVLLNATSMFNHSNIKLPEQFDRLLRWFVVTPDMHRVHHSVIHREINSNFGFNLPWWDYLLGTYLPQPQEGHELMKIGVRTFTDERQVERLPGMLLLPFQHTESASMKKGYTSESQSGEKQL
ncbi:sterol desaturase family protein [Gimesia panareensis]|uniref:sterol desaturase family protein n=1 Tax=Gimesia panareensis TaxID=2527978 RepID=UPI0018D93FD4|nr:sterol desaturase family protein [Gimesia panareensis]